MSENQNATQERNVITIGDPSGSGIVQHLLKPQWLILVYFVILACGTLLNLANAFKLMRSKRDGTSLLILQLCLVDIASLFVATNEILALNHQSWFFSTEMCPFFRGAEVLVNCLVIYLLICINFQAISLWNLHQIEVMKNNKNPLTSCDNASKDDSNEYLVTKQENANRLVTIDYSKRRNDISVLFPIIFIWIVSLSLSVPNFSLSSTLRLNENQTLCAVIDAYYGKLLQHSLLLFKVIIPVVLLVISLIILIFKLTRTCKGETDILTKKTNRIRRLMIYGVFLSILYLLTSFQRQCLDFMHIISYSFSRSNTNDIKMPPFYNNYLTDSSMIFAAMLHYFGGTVRGILCLGFLPHFKHLVRNMIFFIVTR